MSKSYLAALAILAVFGLAYAVPSSEEGVPETLGVVTDAARGRHWVLAAGEVLAYDTASRALIGRTLLPGAIFSGARGTCHPGMVLTRSGELIAEDDVSIANPNLRIRKDAAEMIRKCATDLGLSPAARV